MLMNFYHSLLLYGEETLNPLFFISIIFIYQNLVKNCFMRFHFQIRDLITSRITIKIIVCFVHFSLFKTKTNDVFIVIRN